LPKGLEYLGWRCFEESGITGIHVPGSVGNIKSYTFQSCTNLVDVELGEGIESIGNDAFAFCSSLKSIILPEGLKTLENDPTGGGSIFRDCASLKQVSIPSTIQDLGSWHFPSTLETIISYMEEPIDIVESAFDYWNYKKTRLIVPTGAKAAYLSKDFWKDFENIEEMPSSTDMLTVKHTTIEQGQTASVDIILKNEVTDYSAYQFDLVLPEGFVIAKNEKDRYNVTLAERNEGHSLTVENIMDNRYRFICISLDNATIKGTDGLLLQMKLQANSSLTDGDYTGHVENIIITRSNGDKYTLKSNDFTLTVGEVIVTPADVNGDEEIDVADVVYIVNGILGKPAADYNEEAADVNGDGVVDVADVVETVNIILKKDK